MTGLPRRMFVAGIATSLLPSMPAAARAGNADQRLRALLDRAAEDRTACLAALAEIDPATLSPAARLDLHAARAGLSIDVALARRPGPKETYSLMLRRTTGDDVVAQQLRRRLGEERERMMARADRLFARTGLRTGRIGERYAALWRDSRWHYPDDEAGRTAAVADMNHWCDQAVARLPQWFGPLPPTILSVRAARMSAGEEAAGRQGYRVLPDADRPGRYVVDLREIGRRPRWSLPAVVHHELLPGHMVQLPMEALAGPHPLRLTYAQSFVEGWAIYAEGLAASAGLYRDDPHAELGFCHWRLFRICRARADLGLHLDGWSRADVLGDWQEVLGEPAYFAPFAADLDRIQREPATRAAEAAAWLAIEDAARGAPPATFHAALLQHGRMRTDLIWMMRR